LFILEQWVNIASNQSVTGQLNIRGFSEDCCSVCLTFCRKNEV